jgi:transcriptional regulator with XRE-family HTH domain
MSLLRWAIGTVLRRTRHRQGKTLREVADAAGVSVPYLSEIERGRKEASSEILAGICRALGLRLVDLLEEVRAELLRMEPAMAARPEPGPRIWPLTAGCVSAQSVSALSRSALGRNASLRHPRRRMLATCSRIRPHTTASSSISS